MSVRLSSSLRRWVAATRTSAPLGSGYLAERCGEYRVWAQLDKVGVSVIEHPADSRLEKYCGAGVLPPVGGTVDITVESFAGDSRVQRNRCPAG